MTITLNAEALEAAFEAIKEIDETFEAFLRAYLAALPKPEPVAWESYWAGAGSIDSTTRCTTKKAVMERWEKDGAEITPLYANANATTAPTELVDALRTARRQIVTLGGDVVEINGKIVSDTIQAAVLHVIDSSLANAGVKP